MFEDIRPYHDDEVTAVIQKLINEKGLQSSIASIVMPKIYQHFPKLCRALIKLSLKIKANKFQKIDDIQRQVAKYLSHLLSKSSDGFTFNGLDKIDTSKPALFISNHRDIVLDAALVNLALYKNGLSTVEAAVGDNLLQEPWVADLMRLNKSFIVKRSEKNKRAMLQASKVLSSYIHHCITQKGQNIWIAQREGRAKDGLDKTNSALISMLLLNKDKQEPIEGYLAKLNIIPVSISYEFDPCDNEKAIELAAKEATGNYQKAENEDLNSITLGLTGQKGRVHLEFCSPIQGNFADSKAIAAAIDQQIISNYRLYDSNWAAAEQLSLTTESEKGSSLIGSKEYHRLKDRMFGLNEAQQRWLLTMYANPVYAKETLESSLNP